MDDIALMREIARLQNQIDALRTIEVGGVWTAWTPTLTKLSGYDSAVYSLIGNIAHIEFVAIGKNISAGAGAVQISMPVSPVSTIAYSIPVYTGTAFGIGFSQFSGSNLYIYKDVSANNWAGGETGISIIFHISYRVS